MRITPRQRDQLHELLMPLLRRSAQQIADACNAESSWGGYDVSVDERAVRVMTHDRHATGDDQRSNRLIRNMDAGRL